MFFAANDDDQLKPTNVGLLKNRLSFRRQEPRGCLVSSSPSPLRPSPSGGGEGGEGVRCCDAMISLNILDHRDTVYSCTPTCGTASGFLPALSETKNPTSVSGASKSFQNQLAGSAVLLQHHAQAFDAFDNLFRCGVSEIESHRVLAGTIGMERLTGDECHAGVDRFV